MSQHEHDYGALGAYVLGGLDAADRRDVEDHLAGCQRCQGEQMDLQDIKTALTEVPPELFVDGPPEDVDLVLQRTLQQVRTESGRRRRRRRGLAAAAAAATVLAAVTGGVLIGRTQPSELTAAAQPSLAVPSPPAGTRYASAADPQTRARMTVQVVPAAEWVRVTAAVTGIPEGQNCRLWVRATDGSRQQAGGWVVSAAGARDGTTLQGTAAIPPAQVAAVEVDNTAGQNFVSVPV